MQRLLRAFLSINQKLSEAVDRILPARLHMDGNQTFLTQVPDYVSHQGAKIYDVGGGSQPAVSAELKKEYDLTCTGIDIDAAELAAAPEGLYDEAQVINICAHQGLGDGDVVICQAVLEHVPHGEKAIAGIASLTKPGGRVHIFVPCRNALFARLNLLLPQKAKERILYSVFPDPDVEEHQGFPALYDDCTPSRMSRNLEKYDMSVEHIQTFWMSTYFFVFFPAYLGWRLWQLIGWLVFGKDAAETFMITAVRNGTAKAEATGKIEDKPAQVTQ